MMKLALLIIFMAIGLSSCSGEDDSQPETTPVDNTSDQLKEPSQLSTECDVDPSSPYAERSLTQVPYRGKTAGTLKIIRTEGPECQVAWAHVSDVRVTEPIHIILIRRDGKNGKDGTAISATGTGDRKHPIYTKTLSIRNHCVKAQAFVEGDRIVNTPCIK